MKKIYRIAASLLFVGIFTPVAAQQDDIGELISGAEACDIFAAHTEDPLRVAPGVPDDELIPRLVIKACEASLTKSNDVARHAFQLGRGYLELGNFEQALALFEKSADAGSPIALVYLGDAAQFGWAGNPDPDHALELYQEARTAGFKKADVAIAQLTFDPSIFTTGSMLEVLAKQHIETATEFAQSDLARAYLYAFAVELSQKCGAFLRPNAVSALQYYRFPPGGNAITEEGNHELGVQDVMATYDVEVLTERHGCTGYVVETIANSFNEMILSLAAR